MSEPPDLIQHFGLKLGLIARLWRSEVDKRLAPMGLTQARWYVLLQLRRLPDGVTQKELADAAGVQGPTLVRTLDSLEKEGLIRRCPLPEDRRANAVRLTDKATPLLNDIETVAASVRTSLLADIDAADLSTCLRVFDRLEARLCAAHDSHTSPHHSSVPSPKK